MPEVVDPHGAVTARTDNEARQDKGIDELEMPEMMTMGASAARHMAAGVEDLDELARLVEADTGRAPSRGTLSNYRSGFRQHGEGWIEAERERSRLWNAENPGKNARWRADNPEKVREASRRKYANNPGKAREATLRWRAANPARSLLNSTRGNARKRDLEFGLTEAEVAAMLEPMTCSATGLPLAWEYDGATRTNPWTPSIDRIDNSKGYLPGNVRVVCGAFNTMRNEYPDDVVFALAKALAARAP